MTAHPLVGAYLRDLELLLHGLPPVERGEVLLGVRDHFDDALGANPTEAQVRSVLDELGPAVNIADEAYAAERAPSPTPAPARPASWTEHRLVPIGAGLLAALSYVATAFAVLPSNSLWMLVSRMQRQALPLIAATILLIAVSRLWTRREMFMWAAIIPCSVALLFIAAITQIDWLVVGSAALIVAGGAWTIVRLVRRGLAKITDD